MAKVVFKHDGKEIEVADGTDVRTAVETADADIQFGCGAGDCATCIVEILSGMENLSPISEDEEMTLTDDELGANLRLTCQLKIMTGTVTLKPAEEIF